jgi:hypothetical protein
MPLAEGTAEVFWIGLNSRFWLSLLKKSVEIGDIQIVSAE